jgi:hypothetical protein
MARDHVVRQGECMMSIAERDGFETQTLWNHADNAELRRNRSNPGALLPGDVVHIPDKTVGQESCSTGQKHSFTRLGGSAKLALRLMTSPEESDPEESGAEPWEYSEPEISPESVPRADAPFALYVDKKLISEGATDSEGKLEVKVPSSACDGVLVLYPGEARETTLELNLRRMDPETETSGVCKRLFNLGYDVPARAKEDSPELARALANFQRAEGLDVTGELDSGTRDRLVEVHGG